MDVRERRGRVEDVLERARLEDGVEASGELVRDRPVQIVEDLGALPGRDVERGDLVEPEEPEERTVGEAAGGGERRIVRELGLDAGRERDALRARPALELGAIEVDRAATEEKSAAGERPRLRL